MINHYYTDHYINLYNVVVNSKLSKSFDVFYIQGKLLFKQPVCRNVF